MRYKRERRYLDGLCKGHIIDLVAEVGWSPIQCEMVKKRYLEFKSAPVICLETAQSETQYTRNFNKICEKLASYLKYRENEETIQK